MFIAFGNKHIIIHSLTSSSVTTEHAHQSLLPLTTFLQAKQCDLVEAAKDAVTVIAQLQQERAEPKVSNTLYEGAVELATKFKVQSSKPC